MKLVLRPAPLAACPLCGQAWGELPSSVAKAIDESHQFTHGFDIRQCRCGLAFTSPIPSEQSAFLLYANRDSSNFDAEGGGIVAVAKDFLARRAIKRMAGANCNAVLDYSTGNGRFANAARALLPDATVVASDLMPDRPSSLSSAVLYSTNTEALDGEGKYDLIILRHVLEHVYHPVELLTSLKRVLSPNGVLYIEVPNLACSWRQFARDRWPGFYAPFHVWHYTPDSLTSIMRLAGLHGDVGQANMPVMGNLVSRAVGLQETLPVKLLGAGLFPFQFLAERVGGQSFAMYALARHHP